MNKEFENVKSEVVELKEEVEKNKKTFIEKVDSIEPQVVWQIKDCQELIKTRVSEAYLESRLEHISKVHQSKVISYTNT